MDRSERYLERGLTGRGARRKQGAQDKTLRAPPRLPACPRGWGCSHCRDGKHRKETGSWGEFMTLVWDTLSLEDL